MDGKIFTMLMAYGMMLVFAGVMWYIAQRSDKPTTETQK